MRAWLSRPMRAAVIVLAIGLSVVRAADETATVRILPAPSLAYPNSQATPIPLPRPSYPTTSADAPTRIQERDAGVMQAIGAFPEGTRPQQVVHPESLPRTTRLAPGALGITSGGFDFSDADQGVIPASASAATVPMSPHGAAVYGTTTALPVVPPPSYNTSGYSAPAAQPATVPVVPPPSAPRGYQPVSSALTTSADGRERIYSTHVGSVVPTSAAGQAGSGATQAMATSQAPGAAGGGAHESALASFIQGGGPPPAPAEGMIMDHEPGDMQGLQQSMSKSGCQNCGGDDEEADNYTIALERVPMALLWVEPGYTLGKRDVMRIRLDGAYGWQNPDRLEYLQAKAQADGGKGPSFRERTVDYQDIRMSMIRSGPKFQLGTDMALRSIDGDINHESIGLADMTVNTKLVMADEANYKVSQINNIYIPTGYVTRGMGTGHVSIETGFAMSYKINDKNYAHAQICYWIPAGADPALMGQMWHHGLALSSVLWSHPIEDRAILGMMEFDGWTILTGGQTNFNTGAVERLNPETIFNVAPGLRYILNEKAEIATGLSFRITTTHWFEEAFRLELRWMY